MKNNNKETFDESLEKFSATTKYFISRDQLLKENSLNDWEKRKMEIRSLLNQVRFESIDFLMREIPEDSRKEIMVACWEMDKVFDKGDISDGKYIRDYFHHETGEMLY